MGMYWIDLRKGRDEPMKKYIDYETLRQILKERQIVRDTPDRRDEIGGIIFLIDNMAETNEHEELNEELEKLGKELLDGCRKYWQKRINRVTQSARWIPVTPETMPELEWGKGTETANLILRVSETDMDGKEFITVYAGYFQEGKWWTFMSHNHCELDEETQKVTHWMYADDLMEGVEDNAEIH